MLYFCLDDDQSDYVWILLRSTSNTLQVWRQSTCQLFSTIRLHQNLENIDNDESHTSTIRITSFLVHANQLWIGTSTGTIFVFNFTFQHKLTQQRRSYSVTSPMIYTRKSITSVVQQKQSRSRSESAVIDLSTPSDDCWPIKSSHYRIAFPARKQLIDEMDSDDGTSTTLASIETRSSSPEVISTDEVCRRRKSTNISVNRTSTIVQGSAKINFLLAFKAKIADAPVKAICKIK